MVVGCEFYFVEDMKQKERGYHIVIVAKNNNGVEQINKAISIANIEGFYYKPRIDFSVIKEVFNPSDVVVTSACIAGICGLYNEKADEYAKWFKDYFGSNFFLEIQAHVNARQADCNKKVYKLSKKYNIELIHANDSHYIYPEDSYYRELYLKGKKMFYPEEEGFILDYPDYETIVNRYLEQNVFNKGEIERAIENTLIFDKCEDITLYNTEIKIPSLSENPKQEFKDIINKEWNSFRKTINKDKWDEYKKAILDEVKIISDTNMEEYFILDYKICNYAREKYNAYISQTGRGSAPSFICNKLLKLTDIDRVESSITLYPTRFMSTTRILKSRSLPDIDLNVSNQEHMVKASEDLLGKDRCGWLISYKPLQDSKAFRLLANAKNIDYTTANEIAKNLELYEHTEEWGELIKESKVFVGVIESVSPSPCSMVLCTEDVSKHLGYILINGVLCCSLDGYNCDKYKYLKNDYLKVTVLEIIEETCKLANIKIPNIGELRNLLDDKTFKIYEKGLTCTVNQVDSDYATELVKRYKPKSVEEICAFVASIRPGFSSLLENFITRKEYTTGEKELDKILDDSFKYLLYQESIMKYLIWLGIPESETYTIIKKISKKKFGEGELEILKATLKKNWINKIGNDNNFESTWKVIEDASHYSFNASHSLSYAYDSLYLAYLKAHYPFEYYTTVFNLYHDDLTRTAKLIRELEYFNIDFVGCKFRYSKSDCFFNKDERKIYRGLSSVKNLNSEIGDYLYSLKDFDSDFIDLLYEVEGKLNKKHITTLIDINYFSEFGDMECLSKIYDIYRTYKGTLTVRKSTATLPFSVLSKFADKETEKSFLGIDSKALVHYLSEEIIKNHVHKDETTKLIVNQFAYLGNVIPDKEANSGYCVVSDIVGKKMNVYKLIHVKTGLSKYFKVSNLLRDKAKKGDLICLEDVKKEPKNIFVNGKWCKSSTEHDIYITAFSIVQE